MGRQLLSPVLPLILIPILLLAGSALARPEGGVVHLSSGAGYPVGDFDELDSARTGFLLAGGYGVPFSSRLELGCDIGWHGFGGNNLVGPGVTLYHRRFTVLRVTMSGKLHLLPGDTTPYLKAVLGGYRWAERWFVRNTTGSPFIFLGPDTDDATGFGYGLGGGVTVMVAHDLNLFVEGLWHHVGRGDRGDWEYLDLRCGFTFYPAASD